jgi:ATP-binding cassette subfamily B protein
MISDYLVKLMKLPISFFENKMIGDVLQRAHDYERIRTFIMGNALNMVFACLTVISFGLILLFYNLGVFLVFATGTALYFAWILGFLQIRRRLDINFFSLTAQDQSYWVETVTGMQDIKVNNYETPKRWKWENIQARLYKVNLKLFSVTNLQNLGGQFIDSLKNLLITFFCARAVVQGEMTFGMMISTQIIIGMLNGPIQQFVQFVISAQMARISFRRMNEIQSLDDEEVVGHSNHLLLTQSKAIVVKDVSFQYAVNHPFVLENIKLRIPENKITAIVGHSGCGKTTLLKLLTRLYKPTYGDILIGDTNINNVDLRQWRDKCGVVLQDGKIFNDTILNNIVLDDENIDYEKLSNAVTVASISKEIEAMPLAYKTKMGEQGRGLSGGQKQRILIARALYKDPDYLFFDEATNSLDVMNEQRIVESLEQVFKDKTVVVVAHRLSTIRKADQIIVMHQGKIAEIGNHDSLMENKGYYFHLVQAQANLV